VVLTVGIGIAGYVSGFLDLSTAPHRYALTTFFLCAFVLGSIWFEFHKGTRTRMRQMDEGLFTALTKITLRNGRKYGGYVIHIAIVFIFAGFAGTAFNAETQHALAPGESMSLGRYTMSYVDTEDTSIDTYAGLRVRMDIYERGSFVGAYGLEKRFYYREEQPTTEVAIRATTLDDLYMILVSIEEDNSIIVKAHLNPLTSWIWFGGFLLAFGAVVAMWPTPAEQREMALDHQLTDRRALLGSTS